MDDREAVEMMARASAEIKELRRRNAALAPKAHAYDSICAILGLLPQPAQGFSEDVAWRLDKRIDEIKKAMAEPAGAAAPPEG